MTTLRSSHELLAEAWNTKISVWGCVWIFVGVLLLIAGYDTINTASDENASIKAKYDTAVAFRNSGDMGPQPPVKPPQYKSKAPGYIFCLSGMVSLVIGAILFVRFQINQNRQKQQLDKLNFLQNVFWLIVWVLFVLFAKMLIPKLVDRLF